MAVNTGMVPDTDLDDEDADVKLPIPAGGPVQDPSLLGGAQQRSASSPPPPEVASVDVLAAEAAAADDLPTVLVRDRVFRLRSKVPGMLLMQLSKAQSDLQAPGALANPNKQAKALATTNDAVTKLVAAEDRDDFIEFCEDAEPPMEMTELMGLVGEMMTAITGRPS